jgi:hypothetical protein
LLPYPIANAHACMHAWLLLQPLLGIRAVEEDEIS